MKPIHGTVAATLLCAHLLFPAGASAQDAERPQQPATQVQLDTPPTVFADAVQSASIPAQSPPGRRLLRNTLIGAAIGATLAGIVAYGVGDCGGCSTLDFKAIASGAMYGALVGAAINIHPSRRPSPSRTTISSRLTKQTKAVNVAVRF